MVIKSDNDPGLVMIVGERNKDNCCLNSSRKKMSCSFLDIVGAEERARHSSTRTVSLSSCGKDTKSHKRFLQFSGVETEIELILARTGIFVKPVNFSEMTVCPLHRSSLGIGWRRASRLCSVFSGCLRSQKGI